MHAYDYAQYERRARLGDRTILMKSGKIMMDISGTEREAMTVEKLVEKFSIESDRMLFVEKTSLRRGFYVANNNCKRV